MTWEAWYTFAVVDGMLFALASGIAPTDAVMLSALTVLAPMSMFSDRFPKPSELVAAFGNEGIGAIAALFVLTAGLSATGAAQSIGHRLLGRPRSIGMAQMRLMLPVVGISAFVNNTPVVATLLPVVKEWARNSRLAPSKLFIPLSYAAILGGTCTLIGTSTNLVVQGLLIEAGMPPMSMFTLTPIGLPIALAGILYVALTGRYLLPSRSTKETARRDPREYSVAMRVTRNSPLVGKSIEAAGLRRLQGLFLSEVVRGHSPLPAVGPQFVLQAEDTLFFVGLVQSVAELQRFPGLEPAVDDVHDLATPRSARRLVEAVVSPTSPLVGQTIRDSGFRSHYGAVVIAVHRNGSRLEEKVGDVSLTRGDTLLIEASDDFVERYRDESDFLVVSQLEGQVTLRHDKALAAIVILTLVVVLAALEPMTGLGILPLAMVGSLLMLVCGCCSVAEAKHSIEWSVLLSIGAALGVAKALSSTGAAAGIANMILGPLRGLGPQASLTGIYVMTLLMTELITNNAAAALAFPVGLATAAQLGVSPMPFVIAVAIAASSGYATPVGYQTHMMVHNAGSYRFSDFVRIGVGMDLLCLLVAVTLIPLIFPF